MTDERVNGIKEIYKDVCYRFRESELSNFHLKSVGNFINNINGLPNENMKEEVADKLTLYLLFLKETSYSDLDKIHSLDLFEEYVHPIGTVYQNFLGFGIKSKLWIVLIWLVMINLGLLLLTNYCINIIATILLLILYGFFLKKEMEGKVFCYKY